MIPRSSLLSLAHSLSAALSGSVIVVVDDEKTPREQIDALKFEIAEFEHFAEDIELPLTRGRFIKPPRRLRAKPALYVYRRNLRRR